MTEQTADHDEGDEEAVRAHLESIKDGAGCTEIWEHTSDRREADD